MGIASTIAERLADDFTAEVQDFAEASDTPVPALPPAIVALVRELMGDAILQEAALAWVRTKKRELIGAKLVALYTREQLDAMRERMAGEK